MSPRKKVKESPGSTGGDRIGALPDEVLHHVLSFLPAQEAVRTCLLARQWRHLWKSATGVRIGEDDTDPGSVKDHQEFLDRLLVLRDSVPLETCVLSLVPPARKQGFYDPVPIDELPLVSQHLTRLQLYGILLNDSFLNFSSCPTLEELVFEFCFFECAKISSNSVKRLSMTCCSFNATLRVRVDVPSLVNLRLDDFEERAPLLDRMPSLVDAFVRVPWYGKDFCSQSNSGDCTREGCESCYGIKDNNCVLLDGLSEAKTLALMNGHKSGPEHVMKINGNCSSVDRSAAISGHLEIVEIRCEMIDNFVDKVLKYLSTFNLHIPVYVDVAILNSSLLLALIAPMSFAMWTIFNFEEIGISDDDDDEDEDRDGDEDSYEDEEDEDEDSYEDDDDDDEDEDEDSTKREMRMRMRMKMKMKMLDAPSF
uniref:F-box domain-containing protein n=1 Tax=Oryza barthii TaxID=65489 RepID=A0A0D3HJB2_9ORYZ